MPKVECNFDELGRAAQAGFYHDAPHVMPAWSGMSAEDRESWQQAGIAVVKLFAGRRMDELMAKIEAEKAAGVRDEN